MKTSCISAPLSNQKQVANILKDNKEHTVAKIISGGQTGVDTIGLQVGKELGIPTGGTAPKGFARESGIDTEDISSYGLVEITDSEQLDYTKRTGKKDLYTARTELNVRNSDGTVYFSTSADSLGLIATKRAAKEWNKPFLENPTAEQLRNWIQQHNIKVINVAGNRGSKLTNGEEIRNTIKTALTTNSTEELTDQDRAILAQFNSWWKNTGKNKFQLEEGVSIYGDGVLENLPNKKDIIEAFKNRDKEAAAARREHISDFLAKTEKLYSDFPSYIDRADAWETLAVLIDNEVQKIQNDDSNAELNFDDIRERVYDVLSDLWFKYKNAADDPDYSENRDYLLSLYNNVAKLQDNLEGLWANALVRYEILYSGMSNVSRINEEGTDTGEEDNSEDTPDDTPQDNEYSGKDHYEDTFGKKSLEDNATKLVKNILLQMTYKDEFGEDILNKFGVPRRIPSGTIYAQLATLLINVKSQDDMEQRIRRFSERKQGYWAKKLVQLFDSASNADDIKNALFVTFNKAHITYTTQVSKNGEIVSQNFNKTDASLTLVNSWKGAIDGIVSLRGAKNSEEKGTVYDNNCKAAYENMLLVMTTFENLLRDFQKPVDENREAFKGNVKALFGTLGIEFDEDTLDMIVDYVPNEDDYENLPKNPDDRRKKLLSDIHSKAKYILDILKRRQEETEGIVFENIRRELNDIANIIGERFSPEVQRSTKIGKDVRYNSVNNSFLFTQDKYLFQGTIEDVNTWIRKQLLNDPWFNANKKDSVILDDPNEFFSYLPILNDLRDESSRHKYIRQIYVENENGKEYKQMTAKEILVAQYNKFLSGLENEKLGQKTWSWYKDGLFGDSSKFMFLQAPVYDTRTVVHHLSNIVLQEFRRIQDVKAILAERAKGNKINIDRNLAKNGTKFNFFPQLNFIKVNGKSFIDILEEYQDNPALMERLIKSVLYNEKTGSGILPQIITKDKETLMSYVGKKPEFRINSTTLIYNYNYVHNNALYIKDSNGYPSSVNKGEQISINELKEWKTAVTALINKEKKEKKDGYDSNVAYLERILNEINRDIRRDPAKNINRFLYNNLLVSTELMELRDKDPAYYKSFGDYIKRCKQSAGDYISPNTAASETGKTKEKVLILEDFKYKISQEDLKPIFAVIDKAVANGKLSERQAKFLKGKWADIITATDGQMYRTIASKRDFDKMLAIEDSTGIGKEIYDTIEKDRVPTAREIANAGQITSSMKEYGYAINADNNFTPTQLKNGTQLLNTNSRNSGIYRQMLRLRAIQRFAEENGYDVVCFTSGIKVGLPMKEDVIDFDSDDRIKAIENDAEMPNALKETAMFNWLSEQMIAKPNSTMMFDYQFLGEQTKERNIIIDHVDMTIGTQLSKIIPSVLYNVDQVSVKGKALSGKGAFTLYQAAAVLEKIAEWEDLKQIFDDKHLFSKSMTGAMLSSKKFSSTIFEGMQTDKNGNPLIPFNDPTIRSLLEDKLLAKGRKKLSKILTNGNGDHFYTASDAGLPEKYKPGVIYDENGNLKCVECYVSSIYKEWIEELAERDDEGNMLFSLDKNKLAKFRTKNKAAYYKMLELFDVIGYRVPTEGMCSIIPMRIKGFLPLTNQSTIILPSEMITRTGHDMDGDEIFFLKYAHRKYSKEDFIRDNNLQDADSSVQDTEWENNKGDYENAIVKVGYRLSDTAIQALKNKDFDTLFREIGSMSKNQIHNLIMDLIFETCRSEQGTLDSIKFSSFEEVDRTASLINYINAVKNSNENAEGFIAEFKRMLDYTSSEIKSRLEKYDTSFNNTPMSLTQSINATIEALAGKKFLGIFAVGKAVGAITMATNTNIENGPTINGKKLENLSTYLHKDNTESPAANNAEAVAACPDNSKNPTLIAYGVNDTTINVIEVLLQGGFSIQLVGLLLNQPVVKQICSYIESRDLKPSAGTVQEALNEMADTLQKGATIDSIFDRSFKEGILNGSALNTSPEALLENIVKGDNMTETEKRNQLAIGVLFSRLFDLGQEYSDRSRCLRGDSNTGSAASTNEETLKRIQTVQDYAGKTSSNFKEDFPININYIPQKYESEASIFRNVMASSFPLVNAQYTMGLRGYVNMMSDVFPELSVVWSKSIHARKNYSRKNFKINDLYSFLWHPSIVQDKNKSLTENKVEAIITMPSKLQEFKDNPKYKDNAFIKDLDFKYSQIGNSEKEIPVIYSKATKARSRLQTFQVAPITDGWAQLMIDSNPEAKQFAKDMYMYFLYVYGNFWAQGSLATYRPNIVALSIEGYSENLEDVFTKSDSNTSDQFTKQSLYNHLDLYAIAANSSILKKLKIEDGDTSEVIREKLKNYTPTPKGFSLLYIRGADGVKVYVEDKSASPQNSIYEEITPKSVNLGGVNVLNMDASKDLSELPNMEEMLIKRADEAKVLTRRARRELEKMESEMEADDTMAEAIKSESYAEYNGEDTSFAGYTDAQLEEMYGIYDNSIEVQDIDPLTNESGTPVDKNDNPKC